MFKFELTCCDCDAEWLYGRDVKAGKLPPRCPECKAEHNRQYHRRWRRKNPESSRASKKKWVQANPEKMAAARAKWERENPEARREFRRARKRLDPVANRTYVSARKARLRAATTMPVPAEAIRQRFEVYGNRCWICGDEGTTLDHVKPISKGGAHLPCNIRPACPACNSKKGATWPFRPLEIHALEPTQSTVPDREAGSVRG